MYVIILLTNNKFPTLHETLIDFSFYTGILLVVSTFVSILIIIKLCEIAKNVKGIQSILDITRKDIDSLSSNIPTTEDIKNIIIGTWKSNDVTYNINLDGTYERIVESPWKWKENSTTKGTWNVVGYKIIFTATESTNKNLIITETYVVMSIAMSSLVIKSHDNHSQLTLSRI